VGPPGVSSMYFIHHPSRTHVYRRLHTDSPNDERLSTYRRWISVRHLAFRLVACHRALQIRRYQRHPALGYSACAANAGGVFPLAHRPARHTIVYKFFTLILYFILFFRKGHIKIEIKYVLLKLFKTCYLKPKKKKFMVWFMKQN
jgi:hypothetical protein